MKLSVGSLNMLCKSTNQPSRPDSVHVLYSMQFLAANCRCDKPNWLVLLGSRLSSSFAEHVANAVLKSDYLTWEWHPNKINTRCLCLVMVALSYYSCRSSLYGIAVYELCFFPVLFRKNCRQEKIRWICLERYI